MSECFDCKTIGCVDPVGDDLQLFSLDNEIFPFILSCPAGVQCSLAGVVMLSCCDEDVPLVLDPNLTPAQREVQITEALNTCARKILFCDPNGPLAETVQDFNPANPNGVTPVTIYVNAAATATVNCPDGSPFRYTLPAGMIAGFSQTAVNQSAQRLATSRALQHRVCLSSLEGAICVDVAYSKTIKASGSYVAHFPSTDFWTQVSGTLPTGLSFTGGYRSGGAVLSGTPTTTGTYTFTIRVTLSTFGSPGFGDFMEKTYQLKVVGISTATPLPDYEVGVAYLQNFAVSDSADQETESWSITAGSIPDGFTFTSAGVLSGTTEDANVGFSFTVQCAWDVQVILANGIQVTKRVTCSKDFTIEANEPSTLLDSLLFSNSLDACFLANWAVAFRDSSLNPTGGNVQAACAVVPGKINNGFNGGTGFIDDSATNALGFPSGEFTYAFWLKINSISVTGDILDRPGTDAGYILRLTPAGTLTFFNGNGAGFDSVAAAGLVTGQWYHVVITFDLGAMTIRVSDDVTFSPKNSSVPTAFNPAAPFTAVTLRVNSPGTMNIVYDEIDCWSRVLSDAEAQEHWNNGNGIAYPFE